MPNEPVPVILRVNGPIKVRGMVVVRAADGTELARRSDVALCRCGQSATKPFCDATHKTIPFKTE